MSRLEEIKARAEKAIVELVSLLPEQISYAEYIGENSCYGSGPYIWTDPEPYVMDEAAKLIKELLAEVERLTAEQDAAKDTWTPIEECIPVEGEVVEIVSISKADRARYTPSNNPFWPWSLIDWPTPGTEDGTFFRHREAVTHWRRGPEPGASVTKED